MASETPECWSGDRYARPVRDRGHRGPDAPLVATKFERAPLPGNIVSRPRLTRALASSRASFTLVVAGPGYGKTVAVSQWLNSQAGTIAWVSLDRSDDTSPRFWRYVTDAIRRATGGIGDEALQMLADEQESELVVAALLADLARISEPLVIVLDDLHVIGSPSVLGELAWFVERSPGTVRVVAASRVDPQLPLGRWRAAGQLCEVRQQDLMFVAEETAALFGVGSGPTVEPSDIAFLTDRTEGWAAGLQLAVLSLRDRHDVHNYIRSSLAGDRVIVDYLVGEVLDSLSAADRALVLDLSVLEDFDAALAVAVSGQPDAASQIRSLESRNLFLLPVDDRGERFRFHQLLRELLVAELRWRSPGRVGGLHVAAARHLESAGLLHEAAGHLLAAGEVDQAYRLVADPAWELFDQGDVVAARRWLELFPDGIIEGDTDRVLGHLVLLFGAGRVDEADRWLSRLEVSEATAGLLPLQVVQLVAVRSFGEYIRGDLAESQLSVLQCLALLGGGDLEGPVLDRLGGLLVRQALDAYQHTAAARWLDAMGNSNSPSFVVRDLIPAALRARLALVTGRTSDAERSARHVISSAEVHELGAVPAIGEAQIVLAGVLLEQCRLVEAEAQAAAAVEILSELRITVLEVRARLVAIAVAAARFGPAAGLLLLDATRNLLEHRRTGPQIQHEMNAAECRLRLLDHDLTSARHLLEVLPVDRVRTLLMARASLLGSEPKAASEALDALDDLDDLTPSEHVEALLLQAQTTTGPASLAQVRQAAEICDRHGLVHTFLREGPEVLRLARRANLDAPMSELTALLANVAPARGPAGAATFTEPLTERELVLLSLLPTHLTYREMAGEMCVSINTVKTYQKTLFRKLNASSRSEAVDLARRAQLLESAR